MRAAHLANHVDLNTWNVTLNPRITGIEIRLKMKTKPLLRVYTMYIGELRKEKALNLLQSKEFPNTFMGNFI